MAANAPIALNDAETTPVVHTFSGVSIVGDTAMYANRVLAFVGGRETLMLRLRQNGTVRTVSSVLKIPVVIDETINGVAVPRIRDFATIRTEVIIPLTWGAQATKNATKMNSNLLINTVHRAMSEEGEQVW